MCASELLALVLLIPPGYVQQCDDKEELCGPNAVCGVDGNGGVTCICRPGYDATANCTGKDFITVGHIDPLNSLFLHGIYWMGYMAWCRELGHKYTDSCHSTNPQLTLYSSIIILTLPS